jgi:hypothetical protein
LARDKVGVGIVVGEGVLEIGVGELYVLWMVSFGVKRDGVKGGKDEAEGMGGGVVLNCGVL